MHTQHPTGELDDSSSLQNNLNKSEVMFNKENKALHNPGQLQGPEFRKSKKEHPQRMGSCWPVLQRGMDGCHRLQAEDGSALTFPVTVAGIVTGCVNRITISSTRKANLLLDLTLRSPQL